MPNPRTDDYARELERARELGRRTEHWSDRKRRMAFSGGIAPSVARDADRRRVDPDAVDRRVQE
jgi:hypothetical protein